ncbi:MAG: SCO family protein [Candidatus Rokubacteria bacterium]|nr:SCO family protein [Candidatus Rokubacteria bacterium]
MGIPVALLLLLCLGAAAPAAGHQAGPGVRSADPAISATPRLAVIKPAPDFTLPDTEGWPVRLSALRGRVVLLSFIYTRCTAACPLLTAQMARLQARLKGEAGARHAVRFLTVTVDPARDSAEALRAYAERFRVDFAAWRFLRDEPERLGPVLRAYDEWTRQLANGEVDHPARLYLVDREGRIVNCISMPRSCSRSIRITACRSSLFLPKTRTWSSWICDWTRSFVSLMSRTISFAFSCGIPCWMAIRWRTVPPAAGSTLP